jgi:trk system potassium uptake protein TrkH
MPFKRLNYLIKSFIEKPAGSIIISYIGIILLGAILLMPPYANADGNWLAFINALFTATSAICVTGLIVVDTATAFTPIGQIIILVLIQIGGLGIMIISYFGTYLMRRKTSIKDKKTIQFLLDEQDTKKISKTIVDIFKITILFEFIGAVLLFFKFNDSFGNTPKTLLFSMFHSISAFCNAGFALFSDSMEGFKSSLLINGVIASLIILGGISFIVITDIKELIFSLIKNKFFNKPREKIKLSVNTKVVLISSGFLILTGMIMIYAFEHKANLIQYKLPTQYLGAFFQSVTLRTAGFNTIPIGQLQLATLLIMVLYMFIGGASGSTAGGIKVNTFSIIYAYIRSVFTGKDHTIILNHHLKKGLINRAFLLLTLSLLTVFVGTLILSFTEPFNFERLLFEATSAFGTVGLSTGITFDLSLLGKITIIILMYIGRLGPLTLMIGLSQQRARHNIKYPTGKIMIG